MDLRLGRYVRLCLRSGMAASLVLLGLGTALSLAQGTGGGIALGPSEAWAALLRGEAVGLTSFGIMLIIATPLAGVVAALAVFLRAREWGFVWVALAVLGVVALAIAVKAVA